MYKDDPTYKTLESIIKNAGVNILYGVVHDDSIDGAIWARCDPDGLSILMPDTEEFPDSETACKILGHEMGHILTGLDSPDDETRETNEKTCDLAGEILFKLAEMTAGYSLEQSVFGTMEREEVKTCHK